MAGLCHPNVVKMYGVVDEEEGRRNIVLEYLPLGDLKEFLKVRGRGHTGQGAVPTNLSLLEWTVCQFFQNNVTVDVQCVCTLSFLWGVSFLCILWISSNL